MDKENATVAEPVEEKVEQKSKKAERDHYELHDILWFVAIISAIVSFLVVLIAQACVNGSGYYSLQILWMSKPLKMEFLTTSLASIIAGVLAIISIACGVGRNLLKRITSSISYLPGIVTLILSLMAYFAGLFA